MTILIDTNILLAAAFSRDANHARAAKVLRAVVKEERIVTAAVLSELFYMTTARMNYQHAVQVFAGTLKTFRIENLAESDTARMQEIMTKYADAEFDYADVSIMALAERLNIRRICTFDHTDFRTFQPTHCQYFELLPDLSQ